MKYTVTFDRISRNHDVPPLVAEASDADGLAEAIYRYAKPKCASRDIEVDVDLDKMRATIFAGIHVAGTGSIEEMTAGITTAAVSVHKGVSRTPAAG